MCAFKHFIPDRTNYYVIGLKIQDLGLGPIKVLCRIYNEERKALRYVSVNQYEHLEI